MNAVVDVRPSAIAGQWYPASPERLRKSVSDYIEAAKLPPIDGEVVAVVAPHAGHRYSGPVAGYAFAAVRGLRPQVVAVVSPMHHPYFQPLLTTAHRAYTTPLGQIPVEHELLHRLDEELHHRLGYGLSQVREDPEHSLEIELPFLQVALEQEFSLLPIMVRDQSKRVAQNLGEVLADLLRDVPALLVASTDLSHYYPQSIAEKYDREMLRLVEAFEPAAVLEAEEHGKAFACGRAALAAVMWGAKALGADKAQVLHYATSGHVTGDFNQVVGYGAAVLIRAG